MNVNYQIQKMKMVITDVINQMQNKFLINVKPVQNQLMVLYILFYHFKSFLFIFKGTIVNGNEEFLPTTVTKVTKITESTTIVPSVTNETAENEPSDQTIAPAGESVISTITTTEEIIETTTAAVVAEGEPSATIAEENVPAAVVTDGMDISE